MRYNNRSHMGAEGGMAALASAMEEMEAARAVFEEKAAVVASELARLGGTEPNRQGGCWASQDKRCCGGSKAPPAWADGTLVTDDVGLRERLAAVQRMQGCANLAAQRVHAAVKSVERSAAGAVARLGSALASVTEARNARANTVLSLMDMRSTEWNHS